MSRGAPEETRAALVTYARRLFAERGYSGTAVEDIVIAAGSTRSALHHHFAHKDDLFRAVFDQIAHEVDSRVNQSASTAKDAGSALRLACHAWLDACLDPEVLRILVIDAPSALGWEEWRRLDAPYAAAALRERLHAAMHDGAIPRQPVAPLALLLAGALREAALDIANAPDRRASRRVVGRAFDSLLDGLQRMAAPPDFMRGRS